MDSGSTSNGGQKAHRQKRDPESAVARELAALGELFAVPRRVMLTAEAAQDFEEVDPVPLEPPVGFQAPPTLTELVREQIQDYVSSQASQEGLGTFEEEDDFSEEDPELIVPTPFELSEEQLDAENELFAVQQEAEGRSEGSEATVDPGESPESEPPPVEPPE